LLAFEGVGRMITWKRVKNFHEYQNRKNDVCCVDIRNNRTTSILSQDNNKWHCFRA